MQGCRVGLCGVASVELGRRAGCANGAKRSAAPVEDGGISGWGGKWILIAFSVKSFFLLLNKYPNINFSAMGFSLTLENEAV